MTPLTDHASHADGAASAVRDAAFSAECTCVTAADCPHVQSMLELSVCASDAGHGALEGLQGALSWTQPWQMASFCQADGAALEAALGFTLSPCCTTEMLSSWLLTSLDFLRNMQRLKMSM